MSAVVNLLQDLVRIPSVNPDNTPGTELVGEQAMADHLQNLLTDWGFTVHQDEIQPGRPNLIARAPGSDSRPRVLLGPHLDTVGVGGMTIPAFSGELRDGRIWGRGSSDTKGPMAAMLIALHERKDVLAELPVAIDFVAFMGEESSQWGSLDFAKKYSETYDYALVGEPTSLDLVTANKGSLWATLQCTGKAAHSSQPHLGDNAVLKLARVVDHLNRKLANRLATFTHPVLGHATLNVGTLNGGTRPNIVPDLATSWIDIRTVPELDQSGGALALLEDVIAEAKLPVDITHHTESPSMETDSSLSYITDHLALHPTSQTTGAPWFSDAAHLSAAGIPAVCGGPGSIDQAHTADEFIKIADLEAGVPFYLAFIDSLAAKKTPL